MESINDLRFENYDFEDNKYKNGIIYGAWYEEKYIYIGSTIQKFKERINHHNSLRRTKRYITPFYKFIIELTDIEYEKVEYKIIEEYPCSSRRELLDKEGKIQKQYEETLLNKIINGRSRKESFKNYKEKNKEKIKNYNKEWRNENKEKIKEDKRKWYNNNKKKILEKNKLRYDCNCGLNIRKADYSRHIKSKNHINIMTNKK